MRMVAGVERGAIDSGRGERCESGRGERLSGRGWSVSAIVSVVVVIEDEKSIDEEGCVLRGRRTIRRRSAQRRRLPQKFQDSKTGKVLFFQVYERKQQVGVPGSIFYSAMCGEQPNSADLGNYGNGEGISREPVET